MSLNIMFHSNFSFSNTNIASTNEDMSHLKVVAKTKSQSMFLGKLFRKKMQPLNEEMMEIKALIIGKQDVGKSLFISKMIVFIRRNLFNKM